MGRVSSLMELNQIEYLRMAARCRSITRAAERCGVTQPNVSVAIQKMEKALGVQLIERGYKEVVLTEEGRAFLVHAGKFLDAVEEAVREVEDYHERQRGVVKIGISPLTGAGTLPAITAIAAKRGMLHSISVREKDEQDIIGDLKDGWLDIGIAAIPPMDWLAYIPLAKSRAAVCVSENHPLALRAEAAAEELAALGVALPSGDSAFRRSVLEWFAVRGVMPRITLEAEYTDTLLNAAQSGLPPAIIPEIAAKGAKGIIAVPLEDSPETEIGLVWSVSGYLPRGAANLIEDCRSHFGRTGVSP